MKKTGSRQRLGVRRWKRFKSNRRGYYSLIVFTILFVLSLGAEMISNDKPFLVYYEGGLYWPIFKAYPETTFGGDFETETDYRDPYILDKIEAGKNFVLFPLNHFSYDTINLDLDKPLPSAPTGDNLLGTDDRGRDVLARLIRDSVIDMRKKSGNS